MLRKIEYLFFVINNLSSYKKYSDKSLLWLFTDFLKLRRGKSELTIQEYCEFHLDRQTKDFRNDFLPHWRAHKYWDHVLNIQDYACLARDKFLSHLLLENAGIPHPKLYCYFNRQYGSSFGVNAHNYEHVRRIFEKLNVRDFVCKPSFYSSEGKGVFICKELLYEKEDCIMVLRDGKHSLKEFLRTSNPCLFESLVVQTEQFSAFNPSSVNTIRMITALYPDNTVKLVAACTRIGRKGSETDNAGAGGNIDCAINADTGEMYNCMQFNSWYDISCITHHPDSHVALEGVTIDNWGDIVDKIKSYQARLPFIKMVGWDVALTQTGPVIIEINNFWGNVFQLFIKRGWEPDVRDCWLAWKDKLDLRKG